MSDENKTSAEVIPPANVPPGFKPQTWDARVPIVQDKVLDLPLVPRTPDDCEKRTIRPTDIDQNITEEKVNRAVQRLRLRTITPQNINDFAIIGKYVKSVGVLSIVRGVNIEQISRLQIIAKTVDYLNDFEWIPLEKNVLH